MLSAKSSHTVEKSLPACFLEISFKHVVAFQVRVPSLLYILSDLEIRWQSRIEY